MHRVQVRTAQPHLRLGQQAGHDLGVQRTGRHQGRDRLGDRGLAVGVHLVLHHLVDEQDARDHRGAGVRSAEVHDRRLVVRQHDRLHHLVFSEAVRVRVRVLDGQHVGAGRQPREGVLPAVGRHGRRLGRARQRDRHTVKAHAVVEADPARDARRAEQRAVERNVRRLARGDRHTLRGGLELVVVGVVAADRDRVVAGTELRERVEPARVGDTRRLGALAHEGDGHAAKPFAVHAHLAHDPRRAEIGAVKAHDLRLAYADRRRTGRAREAHLVRVEAGDLDRIRAGPKPRERVLTAVVGGGLGVGHTGEAYRHATEPHILHRYRPGFG